MRASRLLKIQMLLQTRGLMSAAALAQALEVSVRTLYRDIDQLSAAGVPVYAEQGRHGGFRLMPGWSTTLTGLTPSEAQAVFLSGLSGPAAQLGLGDAVDTAQLKLLAALPPAWRDDARRVAQRLHLDPVDWYRDNEPVPQLPVVAAAVWNEQRLALRYESWKATVQREVDALGLVLKAGTWYLVGAVDGAPRTFRVANILHATPIEGRARRPRAFELARHWAESTRRFEQELLTARATVRATATGLRLLRQQGAAFARAVAAVKPPREGARVRLELPVESFDVSSALLLRLAPEVEVLAPVALRRAVVDRLQRAWALYAPGAQAPSSPP
ncbi:MAG: YafY family protein [Rubrivivax sp.]